MNKWLRILNFHCPANILQFIDKTPTLKLTILLIPSILPPHPHILFYLIIQNICELRVNYRLSPPSPISLLLRCTHTNQGCSKWKREVFSTQDTRCQWQKAWLAIDVLSLKTRAARSTQWTLLHLVAEDTLFTIPIFKPTWLGILPHTEIHTCIDKFAYSSTHIHKCIDNTDSHTHVNKTYKTKLCQGYYFEYSPEDEVQTYLWQKDHHFFLVVYLGSP